MNNFQLERMTTRRSTGSILVWTLCVVLAATSYANAADQGEKTDAAGLVKSADRAVGYLVKSARESADPKLQTDAETAKP